MAKRLIGYLPENAPLYADMDVAGFLGFAAELRGLGGDARRRAIDRVVELCFLRPVLHQSIDTLSKGYRHRTCFAQAIIHDPAVLILDEPTDGLDPNQKREVRGLIRSMGEKKAIIFSTHILEEVEAACSRAIIIDRGRIVANGTPEELKLRSQNAGAVTLRLLAGDTAAVKQTIDQLPEVGRSTVIADAPPALRIFGTKPARDGELARIVGELAARKQWRIQEMHTEEGRLDDVFRTITQSETAVPQEEVGGDQAAEEQAKRQLAGEDGEAGSGRPERLGEGEQEGEREGERSRPASRDRPRLPE